jgi:hypothetical protein
MSERIKLESEKIASEVLRFAEKTEWTGQANVIFTTPGVGAAIARRRNIPESPLITNLDGFAIVYIYGSPTWYIGSMSPPPVCLPGVAK